MDKHKFFNLVKLFAPMVLLAAKPGLAPIIGKVTDAIAEAEQFKSDGTIHDKLAHVKAIALDAADTVNGAKGHVVVDKSSLDASFDHAVSTAVAVVNLVHKQPTQ